MTLFYVLLYGVYRERYDEKDNRGMEGMIVLLVLCRVVLCLFPQNAWTSANPPLLWEIARNIPFTFFLHCHCCAFCEEGKGKKRYTIQTSCIDDYHQFWLLSAGCPVCGYDSDNGDADDT